MSIRPLLILVLSAFSTVATDTAEANRRTQPCETDAAIPSLSKILEDGHGNVLFMNQYDAFKACIDLNPENQRALIARTLGYFWDDLNMRWDFDGKKEGVRPPGAIYLPTARDLALVSIGLGARGICETSYPDLSPGDEEVWNEMRKMEVDGYVTIFRAGDEVNLVDFYFDHRGYWAPDFSFYSFWSSSVVYRDSAQVLNGYWGYLEKWKRVPYYNDQVGVRCVVPTLKGLQ